MTLANMRKNILIFTPGLHPEVLNAIIQRAYQDLISEDWSFLKTTRNIVTVPEYSTGTVSINASGTVTGVDTVWVSGMVGRWMNVYYTDPLFEILTVTPPTTLTLRDWTGETVAAGTSYGILKTIYSTYTNLHQIYEVIYGTARLGKKSQYYFDQIDPGRTASGPPEFWAPAGIDSNQYTQIEVYPPCDAIYPLRIHAKLGAAALTDSSTPLIPENLVENKALIDCFRVKANENPGRGWELRIREQISLYEKLFSDFQFEDATMRLGNEIVKDKMAVSAELPQGDDYWVSRDDIV